MKSLKFTLLSMLAAVTLFSSCQNGPTTNYIQKNRVLILNQGNYKELNASVYAYDEDTKDMSVNAYANANNGARLGSTLMSGTFSAVGAGYLVCANPDKIETVNILTMKSLGNTVKNGLSSPREAVVGGTYLFVTNAGPEKIEIEPNVLYEFPKSYVAIYDISNHLPTYITSIEVGTDAQGMFYFQNKLFVGTKEGIAVIEKDADTFRRGTTYSHPSYQGAVKYMCAGQNHIYASVPEKSVVLAFDPYSEKIDNTPFVMPLGYDGYITSDNKGNVYSNVTDYSAQTSAIYRLTPSTGAVDKVFQGENLFSVGVSPYSGNLFTSEVNGYTTNSTMTITNIDKETQVDHKTTGVGTFRYLFFSYLEIDNSTETE